MLWRIPHLPAPVDCAGGQGIAVLVPARDEESALPLLLESLAHQTYPALEIVVVDDHSTDGTNVAAHAGGARVLASADLPDGWAGKCWALHQAVASTTAPLLVFLDADVVLAPDALARLAASHAALPTGRGLVSVQPFHTTEKSYESLSLLPNLVSLMGVGACTPLGRRIPLQTAFGPCLVMSRSDYAAVGGHAAFRAALVEDIELARRFARVLHLPVHLYGGGDTISFRMYPGGLRQLVDGWSRNLAQGARHTRPLALFGVMIWMAALSALSIGAIHPWWAGAAAMVAAIAEIGWCARRVGTFRWWSWFLFPVALAAFLILAVRSAALVVVRRQVRWKGRDVRP